MGVHIWHANLVKGMQVLFEDLETKAEIAMKPRAQRSAVVGAKFSELELDPDERIVRVSGRAGDLMDYLKIETNKGKVLEGGNPKGGKPFVIVDGATISGFRGGYGGDLHNIDVI